MCFDKNVLKAHLFAVFEGRVDVPVAGLKLFGTVVVSQARDLWRGCGGFRKAEMDERFLCFSAQS